MRRRFVAVVVGVALSVAGASSAAARHQDEHCTLTIHESVGTDDLVSLLPVPIPEGTPTDLGSVKIFVNCRHEKGND